MPKTTRNLAAQAVAAAFLPAESAASESATKLAKCLSVVLEEHAHARLAPARGEEAIALLSQAAMHAVSARNAAVKAHDVLTGLAEELDLTEYYGPDKPPAGHVAESVRLRAA